MSSAEANMHKVQKRQTHTRTDTVNSDKHTHARARTQLFHQAESHSWFHMLRAN